MKNFIAALTFIIVFILIKFTPLNSSVFSITNLITTIVIYLIGFIITIYFSYPILKRDWQEFKNQKWIKYLFIIGTFLFMFVILKVIRLFINTFIPIESNVVEENPIHNTLPIYAVLLGSVPALVAPFYEEFAFRNNLFYQFIDKKLVAIQMAIISSILFGAIHYFNFIYTIIPHLLLNWMNVFLGIIGYFLLQSNSI